MWPRSVYLNHCSSACPPSVIALLALGRRCLCRYRHTSSSTQAGNHELIWEKHSEVSSCDSYFGTLFPGFRGTFGGWLPGASPYLACAAQLESLYGALPTLHSYFLPRKGLTEAASRNLSLQTIATKTLASCQVCTVVRSVLISHFHILRCLRIGERPRPRIGDDYTAYRSIWRHEAHLETSVSALGQCTMRWSQPVKDSSGHSRDSMVDVDPDEELARQLHREMNGLTRVRRRAAPPLPPGWRFHREGCWHMPERYVN